jgi:hypothetical protein
MYMTCKVGVTKGSTTKHASILEKEAYFGSIFRLLCWGVPHVPKNIDGGPIKWLFLKREKKFFGAPPH